MTAPTGARAKALGAYYTDGRVARFLVRWAARRPTDLVLDPSFGGGAFLEAAAAHLQTAGGSGAQVFGVELDPRTYEASARDLDPASRIPRENLVRSDFFDLEPAGLPTFDAVVGNPPYIRFQSFSSRERERALEAARREGVRLSGLSASWAPFLVHSARFLGRGGRMAMVVPAELGHASYARPVLEFLCRSFRSLRVIGFDRSLFPELSQETILLLAEGGREPFEGLHWQTLRDASSLEDASEDHPEATRLDHEALIEGKQSFSTALLAPRTSSLYRELALSESTLRLGAVARVGVGYVTGDNGFFHLRPDTAAEKGLPGTALAPAAFRGRALTGLAFTREDWESAASEGSAGYLLRLGRDQAVSGAVADYLQHGVRSGVAKRYKCRTRHPWYAVPGAAPPDAILTCMSGRAPRLAANGAGVVVPNTLHAANLVPESPLTARQLALTWYSSLTALSAELEGHALGGGMLKLEPVEARRVALVRPGTPSTVDLEQEVDTLLRRGALDAVRDLVDDELLVSGAGLDRREVAALREGHKKLQQRRLRP